MTDETKAARRRNLIADSLDEAPARPQAASKGESSIERAKKRAAELRGHMPDVDDGVDEFYIPVDMIPDGWTYEWKRRFLFNKEDPAYNVQLSQDGWEPVPVDRCRRHRAMMPMDWKGTTIERHGMILMERPEEITKEYRDRDLRRARAQVRQKEQQLSATPDGTLSRDADPRVSPRIKKSYEPIPVPEE